MQGTHFEFNDDELNALLDTSFFDLKRSVMEKIIFLLTDLQRSLEEKKGFFDFLLPNGVFKMQGKISRGENYLGYPYLILDYPRIFEKENVFAFRSMFWWGHHFSYTLHAGGIYYELAKSNFMQNAGLLKNQNVFICINENPWEYHFKENNYISGDVFDVSAFIEQRPFDQQFIKLSKQTPLTQWKQIKTDGMNAFELFTRVLF